MARKKKQDKQLELPQQPELRYPTLKLQIDELRGKIKPDAEGERAKLLAKWLDRLSTIEKEMRHLERIEIMTENIKAHKKEA